MLADLAQQWAFQARLSPPVVLAAESLEDTAADLAEWFELALAGRVVFTAMGAVDAFFDFADWLLEAIATFWDDSERAGDFDPLDPRGES